MDDFGTLDDFSTNDELIHSSSVHIEAIVSNSTVAAAVASAPAGTAAENTSDWNSDFSSWIPRYSKPAQPCDYCRSRHFDCFLVEGQRSDGCSPCVALFRRCSFADDESQPKQKGMNTLHLVPEDVCLERGALTGIASLNSTKV